MKNVMTQSKHRYMADIPISSLLQQFLEKNHREKEFKEHAAADAFLPLIPEGQRSMIQKVWSENGKLFVKTNVSGMKFQLLTQRSILIEKVNQSVGDEVIKDIVLL